MLCRCLSRNILPESRRSTPSLLDVSWPSQQSRENVSNIWHQSSFEVDLLVESLCLDHRTRHRGGIQPPLSPGASPAPSPIPLELSASEAKSFRYLDREELGSATSSVDDLLDIDSGAPVLRATGLRYIGFPHYFRCHNESSRLRR